MQQPRFGRLGLPDDTCQPGGARMGGPERQDKGGSKRPKRENVDARSGVQFGNCLGRWIVAVALMIEEG